MLKGNDLVVTGHDDDGTEFQAFGEMHGADRDVTVGRFDLVVEHGERQPALLNCGARAVKFCGRADEDADFVGHDAFVIPVAEPLADRLAFFIGAFQNSDVGRRPVEHGNRADALFRDSIDIG